MYRFVFIIICIFISVLHAHTQPGIYTEEQIQVQALFIDAQLEKQKGNFEKEIEILKEVVRMDRTAHAAYYEMARAYAELSQNEIAEKNARRAHNLESDNIWYISLLIDIYEDGSQFNKAIELCHTLISLETNEDKHYQRLAYNQLRSGNAEAAINTLRSLEDKRGIQEDISKKIFEVYHNMGNIDEAANALRILSNEFPFNARFLNNLAGYLYDNGRKEEAVVEYEKLLKLDPDNAEAALVLTKEKNPGQLSKLAAIEELCDNPNIALDNIIQELMPYMATMHSDGEDTEALHRISSKLLERFPNDAKTYSVRADILFYSGKTLDSEKAYAKAISLDDSKYTLWDQWLINLWELEDYARMKNKCEDAIDYFPNQVNPLIYSSLALNKLGDLEEANEYLMEARFISGNNSKYMNVLKIVETWIKAPHLSSDQIKLELSSVDEMLIYSPIFYELMGDLYHMVLDNARSKENWNRAIELGANKARINKKKNSVN